MAVTPSPNMGLEIPEVLITTDPLWAQYLNDSLELVDEHDHSVGKGVKISPLGMNINMDLDFQENNAIDIRTVRFADQDTQPIAVTDLGITYMFDGELYFKDLLGNEVQITQNGAIAAGGGSISGLVPPASASYSGLTKTFTWLKDTNLPAKMAMSDIFLYEFDEDPTFPITLKALNVVAAYDYILPPQAPVAGSVGLLTQNAAGQTNNTVATDATTPNYVLSATADGLNFELTPIKNLSFTPYTIDPNNNAALATTIASGNPARGNPNIAASSLNFTSASASFVTVTNQAVLYAAKGSAGYVHGTIIVEEGSTGSSGIFSIGGSSQVQIIVDGGPVIAKWTVASSATQPHFEFVYQPGDVSQHTYEVQVNTAGSTVGANRIRLMMRDL